MMKRRLLVIEDDEKVADVICEIAEEIGFEIKHAINGVTLINTYKTFQPDVIVLDVVMPDTDGFEVLDFLGDIYSKAHILIVSGNIFYHDMAKRIAHARGLYVVEENISKPFRVAHLRQALSNIKQAQYLNMELDMKTNASV